MKNAVKGMFATFDQHIAEYKKKFFKYYLKFIKFT